MKCRKVKWVKRGGNEKQVQNCIQSLRLKQASACARDTVILSRYNMTLLIGFDCLKDMVK
jgi:hypothetical protein